MQLFTDLPETADIETSSDDYARRFSGEIGTWFLKVQNDAVLRMLSGYPSASILDVGGGHGQLTGPLVQSGFKVTVLGSSDSCKNRIQEFTDKGLCKFQVGNLIELPYSDGSFDAVISFRLLPHVTSWKQLIRELTRVSRKLVIIDYPSKRSINYISPSLFGAKKRLEGNTRPYTLFNESEILEVFRLYDFIYAKRYAEFFLPMVLHRVLKSPGLSSTTERLCRLCGLTYLFGSPVILKLVRKTAGP